MPPFKPTTPDAFGIDPEVYKKPDSPLLNADLEFLNTPEIAQALNISDRVVCRMIDRRAITVYRIGGKILFRRKDVLAYLNPKEQCSQTPSHVIPSHASIRVTQNIDRPYGSDDFDQLINLIGFVLEKSPDDPAVKWMLLDGKDHRILLVQRSYRDGVGAIINPTKESLVRYRINAWEAWNDSRVMRL